jgi:DNA polymerase III alpha subunit
MAKGMPPHSVVLPGAEVAVSSLGSRLTPPAWVSYQHITEPVRLPLLCETREGYQNLCRLITRFKMRETKKQEGAAIFDDLERHAGGLVCLTGGDEGPPASALMRGGETAGRETVQRLVRIFGHNNVYVELQRHCEREEEWRNQAALRIARSLRLPVLATNGVRYQDQQSRRGRDSRLRASSRHRWTVGIRQSRCDRANAFDAVLAYATGGSDGHVLFRHIKIRRRQVMGDPGPERSEKTVKKTKKATQGSLPGR